MRLWDGIERIVFFCIIVHIFLRIFLLLDGVLCQTETADRRNEPEQQPSCHHHKVQLIFWTLLVYSKNDCDNDCLPSLSHSLFSLCMWQNDPTSSRLSPRYTLNSTNNRHYWGRILGRNPDKSIKSFPPCYSLSPLQLCPEISVSLNSRNLLQFLQFSHCTLYRRKAENLIKTTPPSL